MRESDDLDRRYVRNWELLLAIIIGSIVILFVVTAVKLKTDYQLRDLQRRVGQLEQQGARR